jgi:hypothetical protein
MDPYFLGYIEDIIIEYKVVACLLLYYFKNTGKGDVFAVDGDTDIIFIRLCLNSYRKQQQG